MKRTHEELEKGPTMKLLWTQIVSNSLNTDITANNYFTVYTDLNCIFVGQLCRSFKFVSFRLKDDIFRQAIMFALAFIMTLWALCLLF